MTQQATQRTLTIVGLGPGNPGDMSLGALKALETAEFVVLRTAVHPTTAFLDSSGIQHVTCDDIYDSADSFESTYELIVERVVQAVMSGVKVAYAVPGHPSVFEATTRMLMDRCQEAGISVSICGSASFLEPTLVALRLDPSRGLLVLDALGLSTGALMPAIPTIIAQVYDRVVATDVKLALGEVYGDEHPITVVNSAGVPGRERLVTTQVKELDRLSDLDHLTSVYVPPAQGGAMAVAMFAADPIVDVVHELRGPHGCPWDREQDHMSLRPFVLEEAYEVADAIEQGDMDKLCEELGDLLLQIALHAEIASETDAFDINDVISGITEKMIRRHPHVFSGADLKTSAEVLDRWQEIKNAERGISKLKSVIDKVPNYLPALMRAEEVQKKAAKVGFDWTDTGDVVEKVKEEIAELAVARETEGIEAREGELGDLLFSVVNLSRHLSVNPEVALSGAVAKFVRRFQYIEEAAREMGRELKGMSLEEMDKLWDRAKASGL